ncbi:MAG TPA: Wzz/FepE/Etk N-terminal domain-containing protein [Kribbellaceae bacterium]|nr:Wzz/FepE/Etk N-terminal domain-containing protein [Kribbellaceae bacterium]
MTEQWSSAEPRAGRTWYDDDELYDDDERSSSYPPDNLVTFRFLFDAVRRHKRLWIMFALAGLAAALALPVVLPPASNSSAKILLTHRDGDDPAEAMATDVSLATTHSVASRVIEELKLPDTPDDLLQRYVVTAETDRVLEIVASAPTSAEATALAGTLATAYLEFRQEQVVLQAVPLRRDLITAQRAVSEAEADVRARGGDPSKPPEGATKPDYWERLIRAKERLVFIDQQIGDQEVAEARMSSSQVLDEAAPVPHSARRALVINLGAGLLAGLFIGLGFVVVRALISDKLWRRQDIARALGTRVRLSIGRPPRVRWRPLPRYVQRATMLKPVVQLVVRHLQDAVCWKETPKPALAVVSVDNVEVSALVVASLAMSYAEDGKRVLAADLSGTGALAAALGVTSPGTHESRANDGGDSVIVHLPERNAPPAEGRHQGGEPGPDEELNAAWGEADLVLTLASLSPALGAEHLRTWTSRAVAIVTAGRSSATAISSTGELVRLAGVRLVSAVVVRADRTDESIGISDNDSDATPPESASGVEMITR